MATDSTQAGSECWAGRLVLPSRGMPYPAWLLMMCAYSCVIAKLAEGGDPGVDASVVGTFSARMVAGKGVK